ncbi:MAG TPA: NTP transferase domain-containing protein [Gammaproteobacteria bacterium]|nr:NTP transferase domain-containing protein [Gammaproteobacteria bacterium]
MTINIFIQARMSSSRFPGKVLAPVLGIPLIKHLVDRVNNVKNISNVIVLTSTEVSDDPLVAFLQSIDCQVFRGELNNVFERFRKALELYHCDYFIRLCADSPFIEAQLIDAMIKKGLDNNDFELISNVYSRKFPKGQSVEILKSSIFLDVLGSQLSAEEKEHVTPHFYANKDKYKHLFFELQQEKSHINQCIDTIADLKEIESKKYQYIFDESELCLLKS